jgi:hypothetical protein
VAILPDAGMTPPGVNSPSRPSNCPLLVLSLLRHRLAGERVDVTDENQPLYRELVDAVLASIHIILKTP